MAETHLSQALEATNENSSYDASIKHLLADKQILARILKYAVKEFKDMSIDDIMSSIGDNIEVGKQPVDAGLSNMGRVVSSSTEDNVPGEGKIIYDIRFTAYQKEMEMKFLINLEAQRSSEPGKLGYHIENRIIFYLSRMISAQKQTEFFHSDYDSLKKVRSIWLCLNNNKNGDSIEEIYLDRKTVFGNTQSNYDIDLMRGIIINVRTMDGIEDSKNELISMLEKILSNSSIEDKKRILTDEYGMIMTAELDRRMNTMCNWSETIRENSYNDGIEKGVERGQLDVLKRMIKAGISKEQIFALGFTQDEYEKAEKALYAQVD